MPKIHYHKDVSFIRISELPADEQAPLTEWIAHQTRPLIPSLEPQDAVYSWDYERWKQIQSGQLSEGPLTWD